MSSLITTIDDAGGGLPQTADAHTLGAGNNLMEVLLFSLGTKETFGINVFKVREVSRTPKITKTPNMPLGVVGLISLRGNVIPVVSLARSMELQDAPAELGASMMVAEYNRKVLAFLVHSVDRITRIEWEKVRAPESVITGGSHRFITSIVELPEGRLVSILDVEQILANTFGEEAIPELERLDERFEYNVFFVDDSSIARRKIAEVLDKLGVRHKHAMNGLEAWTRLSNMASHAQMTKKDLRDDVQLVMVDAEMPEMDGYALTRNIKNDPRFKDIPVVMHSSLSSQANRALGKSAGVDAYVAKFDAEFLANTLRPLLMKHHRG